MELKTLKNFRIYVPGLLLLVSFYFIFSKDADQMKNIQTFFQALNLSALYYLIPVLLFGSFYYALDIRYVLLKPFHLKIVSNIYEKLISVKANDISYSKVQELKVNRTLMNIFYFIIDNDNSLKEKAMSVRMNGIFWTSSIDIVIIAFFTSIYAFIKWLLFYKSNYIIYLGIISFLLSVLFYGIANFITYRHIKLSNEQLDYILTIKKDELIKQLEQASSSV